MNNPILDTDFRSMDEQEERTEFQKLERRLLYALIGLVITLIGNAGTAIGTSIMIGELKQQVEENTRARKISFELKTKVETFQSAVTVKLDELLTHQRDINKQLLEVAREQARRTYYIEEIKTHTRNGHDRQRK